MKKLYILLTAFGLIGASIHTQAQSLTKLNAKAQAQGFAKAKKQAPSVAQAPSEAKNQAPSEAQGLSEAQDSPASTLGKKPMSLQVLVGSQGGGINFRYVPVKQLGIRVGGSFVKGSINDQIKIDDFSTKNRLSGELATIHGLAELNPHGFFRFVVGAAYLAKANADLYLQPKDTQTIGDITITPDEIGELNYHIDWGKFAPYIGLGLGRGISKKKFNVNIDFGTYYLQSPKVTAAGTKLLSNNEDSAAQIQENMKDYRFMPVAQLNFNFRF